MIIETIINAGMPFVKTNRSVRAIERSIVTVPGLPATRSTPFRWSCMHRCAGFPVDSRSVRLIHSPTC